MYGLVNVDFPLVQFGGKDRVYNHNTELPLLPNCPGSLYIVLVIIIIHVNDYQLMKVLGTLPHMNYMYSNVTFEYMELILEL